MNLLARLLVALLRLLQCLPLSLQARIGRGFGAVLHLCARRRRAIAQRNLELCFPDWPAARRARVLREHFALLGRSLLERGLLWYAPPERLKALIHVEGDVGLAQRSQRPVMRPCAVISERSSRSRSWLAFGGSLPINFSRETRPPS